MKIAVSTYSYGRYVDNDKMGFIGVMDHAKSLGFDCVEIDYNGKLDDDLIKQIREHSERINLPIIALDVGADFTKNDCKSASEEVERVKGLVDIAHKLGARFMRHDVSYGNFSEGSGITFESSLSLIAECCKNVAEYAATLGVKTMFENHGYFIQHHERVEKLIKASEHPNFGYLLDIGNFMCADDDTVVATEVLAKYADHVHVKDFHFTEKSTTPSGNGWFRTASGNYLKGAVAGEGSANAEKTLSILERNNFDGCVTLEFEGTEDNLYGIGKGFEFITNFISSRR